MRVLWIVLATFLAAEAGAVKIDFLYREVAYRGGLENPGMMESSQKIRDQWKSRDLPDLRRSAYLLAIENVGRAYLESGIYP